MSEAETIAATADFLLGILSEYLVGDEEYGAVLDGRVDGTVDIEEAIDRLYTLEGNFYDYAEEVGAPERSVAAVSTVCERTRQAIVDALNAYGVAAGYTGVYLEELDDSALDEAESSLDFSIERINEAREYLEGCRAGE